jgi:2-octaprenyl-6-methoxyphenol hydroxylase
MSISEFARHDVAVVGAGLAGLTLSLALAQTGLTVALIERQSAEQLVAPEVDGRTTALAASARVVLEDIGVWQRLEPHGGPILDIRVTDRASPLHIHFDHAAVGDEPMGHIVENHILRRELLAALAAEPTLTAYWQQSVTAFDGAGDGSGATATLTRQRHHHSDPAGGCRGRARLRSAAHGGHWRQGLGL